MRHLLALARYWVRPYDPILDARRWRWQRSGCQRGRDAMRLLLSHLDPGEKAELERALRRALRRAEGREPGS